MKKLINHLLNIGRSTTLDTLTDGQVVIVKALSHKDYMSKCHSDVLLELRPKVIKYFEIDDANDCTDGLKVGYYYRYEDGKLKPLNIGKK